MRNTRTEAAEAIMPHRSRLQQVVLRTLLEHPQGCTDEELTIKSGLRSDTERARRNELTAIGLVADSGRRRRTSAGRLAVVWIVDPRHFSLRAAKCVDGCEPVDESTETRPDGTTWVRSVCSRCGRFLGFRPSSPIATCC